MTEEHKISLYHLDVIISEDSMKSLESKIVSELTKLIGNEDKFLDVIAKGFLMYKKPLIKLLKPYVIEMLDDINLTLNAYDLKEKQ